MFGKKKPPSDPNALLLIGDPGPRKKLSHSPFTAHEPPVPGEKRFDTLSHSAQNDGYDKKLAKLSASGETTPSATASPAAPPPAPVAGGVAAPGITSENYQKVYLKQQKQNAAAEKAKAKEKLLSAAMKKGNAEAKRIAEELTKQNEENNLRNRAREIRLQIGQWEQYRGQGYYDDATIDVMIQQLQIELNNIPLGLQKLS